MTMQKTCNGAMKLQKQRANVCYAEHRADAYAEIRAVPRAEFRAELYAEWFAELRADCHAVVRIYGCAEKNGTDAN